MLPPRLCRSIQRWVGLEASPASKDLPEDRQLFDAAKAADAVLITKDRDFVNLVERYGSPPHVIWLTCGNCSNTELERILESALPEALQLINQGEPLVEIAGAREEA
jgi:predicted nuclease of predicted toxin-antitoxin system